ncbi:MAG: hypothetical protein WCG08_12610 [Paludibacter sp.]
MSKIEKYLPYIISLLLPGINILNNHPFETNTFVGHKIRFWKID